MDIIKNILAKLQGNLTILQYSRNQTTVIEKTPNSSAFSNKDLKIACTEKEPEQNFNNLLASSDEETDFKEFNISSNNSIKNLKKNSSFNTIDIDNNDIIPNGHADDVSKESSEFPKDSLNEDIQRNIIDREHSKVLDLNTAVTGSLEENKTLSSIKEFEEVLKEYKVDSGYLNDFLSSFPMPTLSETEHLLNSLGANEIDTSRNTGTDIEFNSNSIHCSINEEATIDKEIMNDEENNTTKHELPDLLNETFYIRDDNEISNNYSYTYEFIDEKANDFTEENSIVTISSQSSNEFKLKNIHSKNSDEPKVNEFEIISISSTADETNENLSDSECDGYNSSDFEFIGENDASSSGLVVKDPKTDFQKEIRIDKETSPVGFDINNAESTNENVTYPTERDDFERIHKIAEGGDFLELFAQPWTSYQFEAESKAFYSSKAMNVEIDNIGFDVGLLHQLHEEDNIDPVLQQEADETIKKIISEYPTENRKRRKRF